MEKYILKKTIEFNGSVITEILMDFDSLTVEMLEAAEIEARSLGFSELSVIPEFDKKYLTCVAAKAADVSVDLIRSLKANDYTQISLLVRNFLLAGGSAQREAVS